MRRLARSKLLVLGCALFCAAMWCAVASFCAQKYTRLQTQNKAYQARPYAQTAALLWPTATNKVNYAYALFRGNVPAEHQKARALLEGLDWNNPDLPSTAYYLRAKGQAEHERDLEKAATTCRAGLKRHPDHSDLWFILGQVRQLQGQRSEALEAQDNAIRFLLRSSYGDAEQRQMHSYRISAAFCLGDWPRAMRAAKEARDRFPQDPTWVDSYASFAENAGQYTAAAEAWQRAMTMAPGKAASRVYDLCRVFGKSQEPGAGEALLRTTPLPPFALHYCRAALYCYMSPSKARQALLKAAAGSESDAERQKAQVLLAASLQWLGNPQGSASELRELAEVDDTATYVKLYLMQAEALVHPSPGLQTVAKHLRSLQERCAAREAAECEDIVCGRQLRMPRYLTPWDTTAPRARRRGAQALSRTNPS